VPALVALAAIVTCSTPAGGLRSPAPSTLSHRPFPVGTRFGVLVVALRNDGDGSLVLRSAEPVWSSSPGVVLVEKLGVVPDLGGVRSIPSGTFTTDPPVYFSGRERRCHRPLVRALPGFTLPPGTGARIWIVVRAVGTGPYHLRGVDVAYASEGGERSQVLEMGFDGTIVEGARPLHPDSTERPCLGITTSLVRLGMPDRSWHSQAFTDVLGWSDGRG
jgi:hypothetical protein